MYIAGTTSSSRITGMASGIDTDQMVKDLMEVEKIPLDKLYQDVQRSEWTMDAYREVLMELKTFEDTYLNYLNPSSNMLSQSTYMMYNCICSNTSAVTVSAGTNAVEGNHTLEVLNVATAATLTSSLGISKNIQGTFPPNFNAAQGKTFKMDVDGSTKTIVIDGSINDVNDLQAAVDQAFGINKVEVSLTDGNLTFLPVADSGVNSITLSSTSDDALNTLGFDSNATLSNRIKTSNTLEEVSSSMETSFTFDSNGKLILTINSVTFEFDKDTTLDQMMNEININPDAGVHMMYDEISDKFIFTANQTGAGNNIKITEHGSSFLVSADITDYTSGEDAVVVLDGQKLTRSDNTFTVAGTTYTVLAETIEPVNMSVSLNTDAVYENIMSFVDAYNQILNFLYGTVSEEYDRDYPPLTYEQKAEMSDEEIKQWEEKAQTGLLSNDPVIESIIRELRQAVFDPIEGVGINLFSIGITTGSYDQNGKLMVDEQKMRQAISNNPQAVMSLFCQESSSHPGTNTARNLNSEERQVRYEEEGIIFKIYDILEDNISIYRNENGQKGILLEKVGMVGDPSEYNNLLYSQIEDYEEEIEELEIKMLEKEDNYYAQFTAMEVALQQMNSQLQAIMSMFE